MFWKPIARNCHSSEPEWALDGYLEKGRRILSKAKTDPSKVIDPELPEVFQDLRWFPLPGEVARRT